MVTLLSDYAEKNTVSCHVKSITIMNQYSIADNTDSFAFILPENLHFYKVYSKYIKCIIKNPLLYENSVMLKKVTWTLDNKLWAWEESEQAGQGKHVFTLH